MYVLKLCDTKALYILKCSLSFTIYCTVGLTYKYYYHFFFKLLFTKEKQNIEQSLV